MSHYGTRDDPGTQDDAGLATRIASGDEAAEPSE